MPYPDSINDINNFEFKSILSLAMLNGDIIVDEKKDGLTYVLDKLNFISKQSGFDCYDIWGVPQYVKQYQQAYKMITNNFLSIKQLFIVIAIASIVLLSVVWWSIYRCRRKVYYMYHLMGFNLNKISNLIKIDLACIPSLCICIFIMIFMKYVFVGWKCSVFFIMSLFLLYVVLYCFSIRDLSRYLLITQQKGVEK